nr:MerR family transcriptional regulator [Pseudopedobacter sp.]
MSQENYIALSTVCRHYEIEMTLFQQLNETGLIEVIEIQESPCIHENKLKNLEKMLRLHQELEINAAGIETIFHLVDRIQNLQQETIDLKSRLKLYEE